MVRNNLFIKLGFLIVIFSLIAGCSYQKPIINPTVNRLPKVTNTPEPAETANPETGLLCTSSLSHIRLPDDTDLYLSASTGISILKFPDLTADAPNLRMVIDKGKIVILSPRPENVFYILETPSGLFARINSGYLVVEYIKYDDEKQELFAHCITGPCEIGIDLNSMNEIETGHTGVINQRGVYADLGEISRDDLFSGCEEDHLLIEITATPTPDINATATASCGEFEENNPGTPCP